MPRLLLRICLGDSLEATCFGLVQLTDRSLAFEEELEDVLRMLFVSGCLHAFLFAHLIITMLGFKKRSEYNSTFVCT